MEEESFMERIINRYWVPISIILLVGIAVGSGILIYRENYYKKNQTATLESVAAKIDSLEERVLELESQKQDRTQPSSDSGAVSQGAVAGAETVAESSSPAVSGKISINKASLSELDSLPGIGPVYCSANYRLSQPGGRI